jgi:hypothetical protein
MLMPSTAITMTPASSQKARQELEAKLHIWLLALLEVDGFKDWKNQQMIRQLTLSMDPTAEIETTGDFNFDAEIVEQHHIVSGYYSLMTALFAVREVKHYFQKYPFAGKSVSREAHLRTCCELLFSRVYHFKTRMMNLLKRLDRKTKPRKTLPLAAYKKSFEDNFAPILQERNALTHEASYSDEQISAFGVSDLLATTPELAFLKTTPAAYRKIANQWAKKVDHVGDQLDLYVGFVALVILARCPFLTNLEGLKPEGGASPD